MLSFKKYRLALGMTALSSCIEAESTSTETSNETCTLEQLQQECGYKLGNVIPRSVWGAPLATQNENIVDISNPDAVAEAIALGNYPPHTQWPHSLFPHTYDVGDILNSMYGFKWQTDEQGNNFPLDWPPKPHTPEMIVVHHTAGDVAPMSNCQEYMNMVANLHIFDNGWGDIGYHYIVCYDGSVKIYQGREELKNPLPDPEPNPLLNDTLGQWDSALSIGAHTYPNTGKIGVALVLADGQTPTPGEWSVFVQVISRLALRYNVAQVFGHKDFAATKCPGKYIYTHLEEIRAQVEKCLECRITLLIKGQ